MQMARLTRWCCGCRPIKVTRNLQGGCCCGLVALLQLRVGSEQALLGELQRGAELQRQLGEKNNEVAQLTEARNVALNQIATLKKHASQLQSFKKNISNMLQVRVRRSGTRGARTAHPPRPRSTAPRANPRGVRAQLCDGRGCPSPNAGS